MPKDIHRRWLWLPPAAIILLPLILLGPAWLRWRARPASPFRIGILDKTVPHPDRREHASLTWVLNHARAPAESGSAWDAAIDYLGYRPETREGERVTAQWLAGKTLVYVADTYGVYRGDDSTAGHGITALDYSERIYGGLETDEVALFESFVKGGGALIAEFNSFASPTAGEARKRLQDLLGLDWSGWSGRWFADLADEGEVPAWARRFWRHHHGAEWSFRGPGYLLAHEDTRLEVLREGTDLEGHGLWLQAEEPRDALLSRGAERLPFRYWFDLVSARPGTEVLARYHWQLLPAGAAVLRHAGLPESSPAILRASRAPLRLYFAGDFADNQLRRGPYWLAGWPELMRWLAYDEDDAGAAPFYWGFYVPMMRELLGR